MAEQTIISWNPANWITVLLMVAIGFFLAGAIAKAVKERQGMKAAA
jgi:FlaG/FlaF family flagellin (archaellin)